MRNCEYLPRRARGEKRFFSLFSSFRAGARVLGAVQNSRPRRGNLSPQLHVIIQPSRHSTHTRLTASLLTNQKAGKPLLLRFPNYAHFTSQTELRLFLRTGYKAGSRSAKCQGAGAI